ncbi:adenylosuccinate lyase [bacterium]|jgi:adenylosuccinate lyase|nr:adenylosuccinate lyase [bacterium]MBT3850322.1 adenylosuccinate lyase [bacterium]MBT4634030.1 adenylosuccinate lyase [bacterium]
MINRYSTKEMESIWSDSNKYQKWLDVEIAVCEAWSYYGFIPKKSYLRIKKDSKFNVKEIDKLEKVIKHDVIAFTTNLAKSIGEDSRFVHLGLTSSDILDTSLSLLLVESGNLIKKEINKTVRILTKLSKRYIRTPIMGRSHGIHAEVTTFGLVLANWLDEIKRAESRLKNAIDACSIGKISGAVGTYSNVLPEIELRACKKLKLKPAKISSQIINRDIHAEYFTALSFIASSIERISIQIRHMQRTEVLEVEEPFSKGQKGSSAMPHKRNPILSENLSGLSRVVRSNTIASFENIPLWHERDISHSSVERVIGPDSSILSHFMLTRMNYMLDNLNVYKENMLSNIWKTNGVIFSQNILVKLIQKGLSREDSYKIVQDLAFVSWKSKKDFKKILLSDTRVMKKLSKKDIQECFDFKNLFKNAELILKRVVKS